MRRRTRGHSANQQAIEVNGFIHVRIGVYRFDLQCHQALTKALFLLLEQGSLADKVILVELDEAIEAGLQRGVFNVHVAVHGAVGFFQSQRFYSAVTAVFEAEVTARSGDLVKQVQVVVDRVIEFPSQFAFVVDPHHPHIGSQPRRDRLAGHPGESGIRQVRVDQFF